MDRDLYIMYLAVNGEFADLKHKSYEALGIVCC